MKEKTIKLFKLITGKAYRELKEEREIMSQVIDSLRSTKDQQDIMISDLQNEMIRNDELYAALLADSQAFEKDRDYWKKQYNDAIKDRDERLLNKDRAYTALMQSTEERYSGIEDGHKRTIQKLKEKLADKEAQRRKTVGEKTRIKNQLARVEKENVKLVEQVEFWKSHRRAPNLQEVKDYTYGRKRKQCEKTS